MPTVTQRATVRNAIDHFIFERLEREGLEQSPSAEPEKLLRRVTLDLTGLPPSEQELNEFLKDPSDAAYRQVVERLMNSPRFGERIVWDWLDAARYADTNGYQGDPTRPMWYWRDWVIKALNDNMPFDQFTREQIAGDLLPNPTVEQLIATIAATLDPYRTHIGLSPTLQRPTLVLNRNWQPINVATVARALIMLWNDSAKIVDPIDYQLYDWSDWSRMVPDRDEPFIQSVRQRIRIPEVIALTKFDAMPTQKVTFSRRNVFKRDKMCCQYCGKQPGSEELTIDHVVPRAQGGLSTWTNCVLACIECNSKKADRTPAQAHMRLRKEPVRPAWKPIYADRMNRVKSWSKFISEAYWTVSIEE